VNGHVAGGLALAHGQWLAHAGYTRALRELATCLLARRLKTFALAEGAGCWAQTGDLILREIEPAPSVRGLRRCSTKRTGSWSSAGEFQLVLAIAAVNPQGGTPRESRVGESGTPCRRRTEHRTRRATQGAAVAGWAVLEALCRLGRAVPVVARPSGCAAADTVSFRRNPGSPCHQPKTDFANEIGEAFQRAVAISCRKSRWPRTGCWRGAQSIRPHYFDRLPTLEQKWLVFGERMAARGATGFCGRHTVAWRQSWGAIFFAVADILLQRSPEENTPGIDSNDGLSGRRTLSNGRDVSSCGPCRSL